MGVGVGGRALIDYSIQPAPVLGPSGVVCAIPMKSMALWGACAAPADGPQPEAQSPHLHPDIRVGVLS